MLNNYAAWVRNGGWRQLCEGYLTFWLVVGGHFGVFLGVIGIPGLLLYFLFSP